MYPEHFSPLFMTEPLRIKFTWPHFTECDEVLFTVICEEPCTHIRTVTLHLMCRKHSTWTHNATISGIQSPFPENMKTSNRVIVYRALVPCHAYVNKILSQPYCLKVNEVMENALSSEKQQNVPRADSAQQDTMEKQQHISPLLQQRTLS